MASEQQENFIPNQLSYNQDDDIPIQQLSGDEAAQNTLSTITPGNKANFVLTVTTIMKTVIGGSILSLPFTLSRLGYVYAILVFGFMISSNQLSCILLLKAKNLTRHSNYTSICYNVLKNNFFQALVALLILLGNLGICIAQLTIFKEATRKLLGQYIDDSDILDKFYTSEVMISLIFALLLAPFTLVKKIEKLKFMAFLGVGGITVFVIGLIIQFFAAQSERHWDNQYSLTPFPQDWTKSIAVIPNLMMALVFQMNFFPIYKGMKNSSDSRMSKASFAGLLVCCIFYFIVGISGYALYGYDKVQANFLLALKRTDFQNRQVLFILINMGFLISVFFSFPVIFFGARNNFIALIKIAYETIITKKKNLGKSLNPNLDSVAQIDTFLKQQDNKKRKRKAMFLFYGLTLLLFIIVISITILVSSLEQVFNFIGAIASNSIAFIFPSLFYILAIIQQKKKKTIKFYLAIGLFVISIPLGLAAILFQYIDL